MSSKRSILKNFYAIGDTTETPSNWPAAKVSGSMAASITGPTTEIDIMDNLCYIVKWTSSDAVGTFSVEGSIDGTTYVPLTFDPGLEAPASNNGAILININQAPFPKIRFVYTRTSGTGTLDVRLSGKGV